MDAKVAAQYETMKLLGKLRQGDEQPGWTVLRALRAQACEFDWVPLAKALFEIERNPAIKDQAWFDFQSKAQRLIALMSQQPQT